MGARGARSSATARGVVRLSGAEAARTKRSGPSLANAAHVAHTSQLDRIIHDRTRLAILAALAASDVLAFNDLKGITGATDGNLSVHARRLEEAGYVHCDKTFSGRTPRTEYRLSAIGRRALEKYLDHMDALIRATRKR
jgi:DNA-binding transcriptional ArsR family regulator